VDHRIAIRSSAVEADIGRMVCIKSYTRQNLRLFGGFLYEKILIFLFETREFPLFMVFLLVQSALLDKDNSAYFTSDSHN
jgi:hypothetical protein